MKALLLRSLVQSLPVAACVMVSDMAIAAPVQGPADMSFYNAPATFNGAHGDLIAYRAAALNLGAGAPATKAWTVKYQSTDSRGAPNVVTGTVIVPTATWSGGGARPIISYAVGTHGLAQSCAPSLQLVSGKDYEAANIAAALKAGYAVLVSDYQGYTNGATPTYLAGASQGHAVLDIVKAASQVPSSGVSASAKVAVWGYSQGGQSAAWAAQRQAAYAPALNVVGVAAGGIPADFLATASYLDGSTGASFLFGGIIGLAEQYPDAIPLAQLTNPSGDAAVTRGKQTCVFESLFELMNRRIAEFTVGNKSLDQVLTELPAAKQVVLAQNLGGERVPVPLYQYHGQADEFIPLNQTVALKQQYCSKFSNVTFDVYPSEHIATQFQAAPHVLSWLGDRFAGKITLGTCLSGKPAPTSTANPGGGNFVVSLKNWLLNATVGLKTLNQTIALPSTSTFTADADMTAQRLNGALNVPEFKQWIRILGIPVQVGLSITPVGLTTGTIALDNSGQLKVRGTTHADIKITSVLGIPWGECKTVTPVAFPLNFDGPVSSLGNGKLNFAGTTSFPQIKGCIISGLLSTLMSGPGQTYSFTVNPPAPVKY